MADEVGRRARTARADLLDNHGPVVAGKVPGEAVGAAEELEEAA